MNSRTAGFVRQWEVLLAMATGHVRVADLAAQHGVTPKTIRRDLVVLEQVFPVYAERDGAYLRWSLLETGGRRVRMLLRKQQGHAGSYPAIGGTV